MRQAAYSMAAKAHSAANYKNSPFIFSASVKTTSQDRAENTRRFRNRRNTDFFLTLNIDAVIN
ncbi:MAG: hypothetical protein A2178_03610 [Planctomycetes bacterium GWC2_49_10]|nr:MAG: hypothetical protein A2178_03610 [Planctomycetes bacterium GWC2_49_10]